MDPGAWFEQEVHAHETQLRAYLRGSFPKFRDVDDVVQESYFRVWCRHAANPITFTKAFLFTVARRLAIDWLRRERKIATDSVEDMATLAVHAEGSSAVDSAHRADIIQLLADAVESLPPRCREVVLLRKFQYLSTRETAEKLGVKEVTVEMQLARANQRIRDYLVFRGVTTTLAREL